MRTAGLALGLALVAAAAQGQTFLDAVLAEVEGRLVTASDVALARALGAFGLQPSSAPITRSDVDRLVEARLAVAEAEGLGIAPTDAEVEEVWQAAVARTGGPDALARWLEAAGIEHAWARALAVQEARRRRFVALRFRAFVFVPEDEVRARLGAGAQDPEARAQARAALAEAEVARRLAAWTAEAAGRGMVRVLLAPGETVPCPLPMPGHRSGAAVNR